MDKIQSTMDVVHRLFLTLLVISSYLQFINGIELDAETNNNANVKQSLDEISREVNEMKTQLTTSNSENPDTMGDGDNSQRAIIGEIDKIKKIAEILETVVLPTIVDSQTNGQKQNQNNHGVVNSNSATDPIKILPKGLKLLQHHNAITSNVDDGQTVKAATLLDDN